MIKTLDTSWWGIKNSGDDISNAMLNIVNNASAFIVVGGYNFTFSSSAGARPFFDALVQKLRSGVQVMMVFPPSLYAFGNPQPAIIRYCLRNRIGVILNHQNHSKWLLTDSQMYYGSSNFTNTSWRRKVEVVSLHDYTEIQKKWAKDTVRDFYKFINQEMTRLEEPARKMRSYRGLINLTRTAWGSLQPLILRLNPSIEKVKQTLYNYDQIQSVLKEQVTYWFDQYENKYFDEIFKLSIEILHAIDSLCSYAYANIYNETVDDDDVDLSQRVINNYNTLHQQAVETINAAITNLPDLEDDQPINSQFASANISRLAETERLIYELLRNYLR